MGKLNSISKFLLVSYLFLLAWWCFIQYLGTKDSPINYWFAFAYGIPPILGGFFGIITSKKWGLFKSALGRAIFFLSLGLITWGVGEMIWSFYTLALNVEVPYPSLADVAFIVSWPFWTVGLISLSKATGVGLSLRQWWGKLIAFVVPAVVIVASYYLLYVVARGGSIELSEDYIKLFFDLVYPIWDVVLLTVVMLIFFLSVRYLGGRFVFPIMLIIVGFIANYFADMGLSYLSTIGEYYNGGFPDLMFATAMCLLPIGVNMLDVS